MIVGTLASVSAYSAGANGRNAWYMEAVSTLQGWGVLSGEDADAAVAGKTISRAQFNLWVAKILSQKTDKLWDASTETRYEDVENAENKAELYPEAIAYTTANGIVQGYTTQAPYQFGPNDNLKLGQAAAVVVRLLSRMGNSEALFSATYMKLSRHPLGKLHSWQKLTTSALSMKHTVKIAQTTPKLLLLHTAKLHTFSTKQQ